MLRPHCAVDGQMALLRGNSSTFLHAHCSHLNGLLASLWVRIAGEALKLISYLETAKNGTKILDQVLSIQRGTAVQATPEQSLPPCMEQNPDKVHTLRQQAFLVASEIFCLGKM